MNIRNIAIIAHVDHGKTTLVDGFLKQTKVFRDNEAQMSQSLIMDSNDQEKERGITIMAKNIAVEYNGVKINIIDTPGHADFGGEVERILNMADGAILVVDAQEGPMPQTKFVLKKALDLGLKIIVVINKIDKKDARVDWVIEKINDLFLEMAINENQLDFPICFAIARDGKSWKNIPTDFYQNADLSSIFQLIIENIPSPKIENDKPFQMLVTTLDRDNYHGKYIIGKISRGRVSSGMNVALIHRDGKKENAQIDKIFINQGFNRIEVKESFAGEIVALTGVKNANIGDTISCIISPEALPTIQIEEPTLKISISANTSPFVGREGNLITGRQILERIEKELETNIALKMEMGTQGDYILSGRGELHLSVFIETLRREGFELQVGKPQVIIKEVDGIKSEPVEELIIDVDANFAGAVTGEVGKRRGILLSQENNSNGTIRLIFEITTRGILGLRNTLLTISKGTAVINSSFLRFQPYLGVMPRLRNGVLIASGDGKAVAYGLNIAQGRGIVFIPPQIQVYRGMIIGLNSREEDLEINVCKEKKLSNTRASGSDDAILLTPPIVFTLEQSLNFLEEDELLEVTPKSLRLRKIHLDPNMRSKKKNS